MDLEYDISFLDDLPDITVPVLTPEDVTKEQEIFNAFVDVYKRHIYGGEVITFKDHILPIVTKGTIGIFGDHDIELRLRVFFNCFCSMVLDSSLMFPNGEETTFCGYYSLSACMETHPQKDRLVKALQNHLTKTNVEGILKIVYMNPTLLLDPIMIRASVMHILKDRKLTKFERDLFASHMAALLKNKDLKYTSKIVGHALSKYYEKNPSISTPLTVKDLMGNYKFELSLGMDKKKTSAWRLLANPAMIDGCIDAYATFEDLGMIPVMMEIFARIIKVPIYWVNVTNKAQGDDLTQLIRPYTMWHAFSMVFHPETPMLPTGSVEPIFIGIVKEFGHVLPVIPLWRMPKQWNDRWVNKLSYIKKLCKYTNDVLGSQIMDKIISSNMTPMEVIAMAANAEVTDRVMILMAAIYNIDTYGGHPPDNDCHDFTRFS
jgi:hypothetical protein